MAVVDATMEKAMQAMSLTHDAKDWTKCVALGDAWVAARTQLPAPVCILYSQALQAVGRLPEAKAWAKVAAEGINPEEQIAKFAARTCYAMSLARLGRFGKARRILKQSVETPIANDPDAIEKQAIIRLSVDRKWDRAWADHEARLQLPTRGYPPNCTPWDGSPGPVSVLHEQGIGDAVLAGRWLPMLADRCQAPVTYYGPQILHRWMAALDPRIVIGTIENARDEEVVGAAVRILSLPYRFGVRSPKDVPPPSAPAAFVEQRRARPELRGRGGTLRVGVCWQGAKIGWHDFERSYLLPDFRSLVEPLDGVEFVNLTHGAPVMDGYPFESVVFQDVMACGTVIADLDLVATVDTSVAHIAGSIGVPTLALVPTVPDWRYEWPYGKTSPFYPSMTVVRKRFGTDLSPLQAARAVIQAIARKTMVAA